MRWLCESCLWSINGSQSSYSVVLALPKTLMLNIFIKAYTFTYVTVVEYIIGPFHLQDTIFLGLRWRQDKFCWLVLLSNPKVYVWSLSALPHIWPSIPLASCLLTLGVVCLFMEGVNSWMNVRVTVRVTLCASNLPSLPSLTPRGPVIPSPTLIMEL